MRFSDYDPEGYYDELLLPDGSPRPGAAALLQTLASLSKGDLAARQQAVELAMKNIGITFTVYGDSGATERIIPFDLVPRIVPGDEWAQLEVGLKQRVKALNAFLGDVYGPGEIMRAGRIPEEVVKGSRAYLPACEGLQPPGGVWIHVTGPDLIRGADGQFMVLEDNLRCPSGVSYLLQNRQISKRTLPKVFEAADVRSVEDYPQQLHQALVQASPRQDGAPVVVVLTPGRRMRPTSSTPSSRSRWAWSWWRDATWWCTTAC